MTVAAVLLRFALLSLHCSEIPEASHFIKIKRKAYLVQLCKAESSNIKIKNPHSEEVFHGWSKRQRQECVSGQEVTSHISWWK